MMSCGVEVDKRNKRKRRKRRAVRNFASKRLLRYLFTLVAPASKRIIQAHFKMYAVIL